MSNPKSAMYARNVGAMSVKWQGKCPSCGEWDTMIEEITVAAKPGSFQQRSFGKIKIENLADFGPKNLKGSNSLTRKLTGLPEEGWSRGLLFYWEENPE